jgi:excisionase family DNA binding protein
VQLKKRRRTRKRRITGKAGNRTEIEMDKDESWELLTPEELCSLLKIKKQRLYEWVHLGRIPYLKVGRFLRFSRSRIQEWLESQTFGIIENDETFSE